MRLNEVLVASIVVTALGATQHAVAQANDAPVPSTWEPAFWEKGMLAAKEAQSRGDKSQAEGLCARLVPYAEAQGVKALLQFAELLESKKSAAAAAARARADKLAEVKAAQARGNAPSSTYLGFAPWEELYAYAGALEVSNRDSEAQSIRLLAAAYRRSQEVYVRRTMLMREGKDPRGEC